MMGDESLRSASDSRSGQSVGVVKTGVVTVSGVNVGEMLEKTGASCPKSTGEKLLHEESPAEYRGIFLKTATSLSNNERNGVSDRELASKNIHNLLEEGSKALVSGNYRLALSKHQEAVDELTRHPTYMFDEVTKYIWFKYAYFISLIEVNDYPDLINAFNSLPELMMTLFAEMPTYHYAVAKLLLKFNRFQLAEEEIQKCRDAMGGHDFKKHFWFSTKEVIKEATKEGLESYLQELSAVCRHHHIPNATCKYEGCITASSHPYPSREIFHSDPDFKGYVVVICQEGCKVHYHPLCWKNIKESLTKLDKLSDKECLGKPCLTPDCKNSAGEQSVIQKIEIVGADGNIKSQCVQDITADVKQKENILKKRHRQISDEHKNGKPTTKNKLKTKKGPERSQSSEVLDVTTKIPLPKDSKPLQIIGIANIKQNMPAKENHYKHKEMSSLAGEYDFLCSYIKTVIYKKGPLSKENLEEEWGSLSQIFKPLNGLVKKNSGIFNFLKNSPNFNIVDNLLFINEPVYNGAHYNNDSFGERQKMEKIATDSQPTATQKEPMKPTMQQGPSKQPEFSVSDLLKDLNPLIQLPSDVGSTTSKINNKSKDWAKENVALDSEIEEIEEELLNRLSNRTSQSSHDSSELLQTKLLDNLGKDQTKIDEVVPPHLSHVLNKPFSFPEEGKTEKRTPSITPIDQQKVTGIPIQKSDENLSMMHQHPNGFILLPPPIRPPSVIAPIVPPPYPPSYPPTYPPPQMHWPVEGLQPQKNMPFGNQEQYKQMLGFPPSSGIYHPYGYSQPKDHKDISIQTEGNWEERSGSGDETWVQHMQLAVNELMKKNRDLMQSKEQLIREHEFAVKELKSEMQELRQRYEHHFESLKESINRNEEDRRRYISLEGRMKLQEQILNSTKEDLRNKDFHLLEAKRLLGVTVLERVEKESSKQVTRLVTALASLPCNGKEAEAVGQAMSEWESTGNRASKAKSEFIATCMRHQAKLIDGYGSDSLSELVIPVCEEPSGQCPLDSLTLKLLHDKENSMMNSAKNVMSAPVGIPPFRNRSNTAAIAMPTTGHSTSQVTVPAPLSPVTLGARPRDSSVGETSLRKWPSSHSVQSSTHSTSGGNARVLSNFSKLLIELKRCYPSRTENELCSAIKLTRKKHKNTLSGLTIEKIVAMVGNVLEWWPEPVDGAMGLDKFMGWASDVTPADETFCSISKDPQRAARISSSSGSRQTGDKDECCICLQGMSDPKTDLNCSHSFHTNCIRKWLSEESVCPICRKFTRMPDEFPTLK